LAKACQIATSKTSFLVLSELASFLEHQVEPPKNSLPKIHEEWLEKIEETKRKSDEKVAEKLNWIHSLWSRRMELFQLEPISSQTSDRGIRKANQRFIFHDIPTHKIESFEGELVESSCEMKVEGMEGIEGMEGVEGVRKEGDMSDYWVSTGEEEDQIWDEIDKKFDSRRRSKRRKASPGTFFCFVRRLSIRLYLGCVFSFCRFVL